MSGGGIERERKGAWEQGSLVLQMTNSEHV